MDTTASSRPDFRDHHNPDNSNPFQQHSFPSHSTTPSLTHQHHYSHSTSFSQPPPSSAPLQPYLPSARHHSLLTSPPPPHNTHDPSSRHPPPPLPPASSSLTRAPFSPPDPMLRHPPLPQPPTSSSHPQQSSLYQPQFKPRPSQTNSPLPNDDNIKPSHPISSSTSQPASHHPLSLTHQPSQPSQLHDDRPFQNHPSPPTFPPPSAPLSSLDKKPHPFPYTKSLPYPLGQPSQPSTKPPSTAQTTPTPTATASATTPTAQQSSTHQPHPTNSSSPHQEQGPLYDIAKLLAAHCTILSGKVYNDKGHNICGVLNQHDKPCKRIGKCPFHGVHKPVTTHNSVNGTIDASGTVSTPSTSPDATHSPPGQSGNVYDNRSSGGSDSTAVNGSTPRPPPKQQYKHGWSKEEHFLFLGGLNQHGKGSWKQIASVVKTRTPTQVQSHAQKYFQRQKQADKNKRSIHDLSLDSPEMIEVAKKFKTGGQRIGLHAPPIGEPLPLAGIPDGPALRGHPPTMAPSALSLSHNPLHAENVGRGVLHDTGLARFGSNVHNSMVSKFGPPQATSATTLGSSLSSGVQISQIPGGPANRSFPIPSTNVGQPELFAHLHHGTINSGQQRRPGDNRLPLKMDGAPGRDVILNAVRPAFMSDAYQGNTSGQLIPGQHLLGTNNQQKASVGLHANETGTTADHGTSHAPYPANALQGLYPQMGSNPTVFHQPRGGNDSHIQWTYDSEGKPKRPREVNTTNRDAFHLQNSQLSSTLQGTTLQGIGPIPIPEHLSAAPGIGNEHQVDQPFDATQQNQGSAFASGIFGSNESVEVDTNVYGVGAGQPSHVAVSGRLGTGVSGYPQTTGVPMGQVHLHTSFGGAAGSYHRND